MAELSAWFFKGIVLWISVSVLIAATAWYVGSTIRDHWPKWWRRHVVGRAPGKSRI